jgi:hypothetical protein
LRHELGAKTLEYSAASLRERWASGRRDMESALTSLASGHAEVKDRGYALYGACRQDPSHAI